MIREFLVQSSRKHLTSLDAGCGCGDKGIDAATVGIDVSKENIRHYITLRKRHAVIASVTALPFREKTFDIVACMDVLEHVRDKQAAINELCRVGNVIIGTTSNLQNPEMLLDTVIPKKIASLIIKKLGFGGGEAYERRGIRFTVASLTNAFKSTNRDVDIALIWQILFETKMPLVMIAWTRFHKLFRGLNLPVGENLFFITK
jgi:SAM-dependent methyltransferase